MPTIPTSSRAWRQLRSDPFARYHVTNLPTLPEATRKRVRSTPRFSQPPHAPGDNGDGEHQGSANLPTRPEATEQAGGAYPRTTNLPTRPEATLSHEDETLNIEDDRRTSSEFVPHFSGRLVARGC
jgi:hypothetical protein